MIRLSEEAVWEAENPSFQEIPSALSKLGHLVTLCQCYIANRKAWTPANLPRFCCLGDSFSSYECKQKVLEGNLKWYPREHMNDKKKKKQSSLITDMEKVLAVLIEDQASHSIP
jgi:hypothetical protein